MGPCLWGGVLSGRTCGAVCKGGAHIGPCLLGPYIGGVSRGTCIGGTPVCDLGGEAIWRVWGCLYRGPLSGGHFGGGRKPCKGVLCCLAMFPLAQCHVDRLLAQVGCGSFERFNLYVAHKKCSAILCISFITTAPMKG